jgi:hypothetical protein
VVGHPVPSTLRAGVGAKADIGKRRLAARTLTVAEMLYIWPDAVARHVESTGQRLAPLA